jgi:DNA polymerase eta
LKFLSQSQSAFHEKRIFDGLISSNQGSATSFLRLHMLIIAYCNQCEIFLTCEIFTILGHESSSGTSEAEQHGKNNTNTAGDHSAGNTWMLNVEDIDPAVVGELPLEIQREIQGWIRPSKLASTKKRGSTISSYFSPSRR